MPLSSTLRATNRDVVSSEVQQREFKYKGARASSVGAVHAPQRLAQVYDQALQDPAATFAVGPEVGFPIGYITIIIIVCTQPQKSVTTAQARWQPPS